MISANFSSLLLLLSFPISQPILQPLSLLQIRHAKSKEVANNRNIPTVGEWELDLLTRLRVQREEREQARGQILSEFRLLVGMTQAIIATAHPQDVAAQNMLWELHGRAEILRMEWIVIRSTA
ncbi:hypothetical protein PCH_Pc15g02060 [Penicillium rubens Wisconsin 54-1255]|uniref:Uncharacterized protein n=1 Tax=Penicillium rubens (strain ATCC 28089 / DSM 1075 / NRRL 1951 / Wisconsin 54-1255) TaxID=500485 RepID=B6H6E0_PENRW|nr:hypothetical protein PCH_Pc15g02060 [Penicillium rubens Wisconsin 54-1255]